MALFGSLKLAAGLSTVAMLGGLTTGILYQNPVSGRPAQVASAPVPRPLPAPDDRGDPLPLASAEWTATPRRVEPQADQRRLPSTAPSAQDAPIPAEPLTGAAATNGSAVLRDPPGTRAVYPRAEVIDGRSFRAQGSVIRFADIEGLAAERTCKDAKGTSWPCGKRAQAALQTLLRGRAVTCFEASHDDKEIVARCRVGRTDIGAWLVEQGWARVKINDERLNKLQTAARNGKAGQYTADASAFVAVAPPADAAQNPVTR